MVPTPNFIDYLKSGLQLNLVVAIDFTGILNFYCRLQWYPIKCKLVALYCQTAYSVSACHEEHMGYNLKL